MVVSTKFTWQEFGEGLLDTRDLDPIYVMLWEARDKINLAKWLMTYWMFYDAGTSSIYSQLSDEDYWPRLIAEQQPLRRSAERRHFRGQACIEAMQFLSQRTPEYIVGKLSECKTYEEVSELVQLMPLFGPWITFKIGDMLERLDLARIDMSHTTLSIYSEPRKGASLILYDEIKKVTDAELDQAVGILISTFKDRMAPPRYERHFGLQEAETILCKYKSHWTGHYPVGKDIKEIRHSLTEAGDPCDIIKYLP